MSERSRTIRSGPRVRAFALAALLLLTAGRASGAGWTRDPGHFYLQLGSAFSYGHQQYTIDGQLAPIVVPKLSTDPTQINVSNYQQLLNDLYFEVGALPRFTIIGYLPFLLSSRALNPGGDINYTSSTLGDMWLGGRVGLVLQPIAFSLEMRLGFPTGDAKLPLPTGSGDFRGELRAVLSHAFEQVPLWFDVEFGFVLRGAGRVYNLTSASADHTSLVNFAPQMVLHGELGAALLRWRKANRLLLIASVDYVGSTTKSAATEVTVSLYPENSELTTINGALMGFFWRGLGALLRVSRTVEGLRQPELTTFGGALFAQW
jgi:hypothetical protein